MDDLFSSIQKSFLNTNKDNKQSLLQQQQISQQQINELLEKSAEAIVCGPDCQKTKITAELKQKYLDAQTNLQTAPIKLEESKQNYYIYKDGQTYYDNMKEEELKTTANELAKMLEENFNNEVTSANTMNNYLNTALINSENTTELYNEYLQKNSELEQKLKDRHGDILTNDRKTYYETDALNTLLYWYSFFWYIYYVLVVIVILALSFSPNSLSLIKKIIICTLIVFYPYYVDYIIKWIYGIYKSIINMIPKNVYNNL